VQALNKILRLLALLTLSTTAFATTITGVVTNRTTGKPSAGDTVVLLRLAQGMQELAHTTTDSRGRYSIDIPAEGFHLLRVSHDNATYFGQISPNATNVDIDVYSAAAHVKGVTTEAVVLRLQTDAPGQNLRVVENFFVKNDSAPPTTQFSAEPFDFYLPEGAVIEGAAALGPGGNPLKVSPVPLAEKNKFTYLFPIRPGETRFQVSYHLPYSGHIDFPNKLTGPTGTVAIMLPKSITFTPAQGSPLGAVNDDVNAQTFVAQNVSADQPVGFTLSGKGELPRDTQSPTGGPSAPTQGSDAPVAATDNTAPGKGLDNPLDPNGDREPLSKYKWWILGGLALLLAAAAGVLLRKPTPTASTLGAPRLASETWVSTPQTQNAQLLHVLKEELFALETDRLQSRISDTDYAEQKAALELILRRALNRTPSV
jgi:hypothetical protein